MKKKKQHKARKFKSKASQNYLSELKPGDTIEVIAPASHAQVEHLIKGVEVLKSWGFRVIYDSDIIKPHAYLAQSDDYRFKKLKQALANKQSKAVWCLRGGYGSLRLLPMLEKTKRPPQPKILIGLSDITSLQVWLGQKWNWPSLHTSMVDRMGMGKVTKENLQEIHSALCDADHVMKFKNLVPLNSKARKKQKIKSVVTGGNLVVLASSLGTPSQFKAKGQILFLEEIGERAYRVDRYLEQLKQAGVFNGVRAVIFGDFTQCEEPNGDNLIPDLLRRFSAELKIPVYRGLENGHGVLQRPLFFNSPAELSCGESAELSVQSPFRKVK